MASKSLEMRPQKPTSLGLFPKITHNAPGVDLSGQVAIITGANTGLGFHCARHLLGLKLSHLILAVRSMKKGEDAAAKLQKEFPSARVEVWELEMISYDSIRSFVRRVETDLSRLDITILNSGLAHCTLQLCKSTGHCGDIQVNFLSTFLLAILMLQALKNIRKNSATSSPSRLTIVSSGTALTAKFPNRDKRPLLRSFDDPSITPFDTLERYGASRLLGHLFFPGLCKGTELFREAPFTLAAVFSVIKTFTALSVEDGAWFMLMLQWCGVKNLMAASAVRGRSSRKYTSFHVPMLPFMLLDPDRQDQLTQSASRFANLAAEGGVITDTLWEETLDEFEFAGVREMLKSWV